MTQNKKQRHRAAMSAIKLATALSLLFFANTAVAEQQISLKDIIQSVLEYNLDIEKQKTFVERTEAASQQLASQFDWQLTAEAGYRRPRVPASNAGGFLTAETETNNVYNLTIGMGKQLRNGITVSPGVYYSKNMTDNSSDVLAESVSLPSLAVRIPLLRGRGTKVTTANEKAAEKRHIASKLNKDRLIAHTLAISNARYWASVAAKKNLMTKRLAEKEATTMAETLKKLSEQGEISILEYQSSVADLNLRRLKIEKSAATWNSTRRKLARLLQNTDIITNLPDTTGEFPDFDVEATLSLDNKALINIAFEQRRDLLALQQTIQSANLGLLKARNDLWPQLDVNLDLDKANISYTQSLGNNLGKGRKREAAAQLMAYSIDLKRLKKAISDEVHQASENLQLSLASYQHAHEAHRLFEQIAKATKEKVSQGTAARNEYLSALDKLSEVEQLINKASVDYLNALAQLRLTTGTLPIDNKNINRTLNALLTVPTNG